MTETPVVVVGGGPAGLMLAYQLVSSGIPVHVLERHPDFEREFRGELMQRSVVEQLERAGLLRLLADRGLVRRDVERRMFVGLRRRVHVPGPVERGAILSQPGFLAMLDEQCRAHPGYRLDLGTGVVDLVREGGRVVGVTARRRQEDARVGAALVVVCNGRNSALRRSAGLETETFPSTADALWLRFHIADAPDAMPASLDVHMFGKGVVTVLSPSTGGRLHIAYSAPGDLAALRKDLPALRRALLPTLAEPIRGLVAARLDEATESQMLKIIVDRVKTWHAPGVLFLGDAAHTMSPSGGQGLNVAIRDTFTAANHLVPRLRQGAAVDADVLQAIQAEREPEIAALQAAQTRAGQMVLKPKPVLHVMFTLMAGAMAVAGGKLRAGHGIPPPEPRHLHPPSGVPSPPPTP
jgi:2-polyprenyl-6-methoxyphenol hydroxylase-like FAD-dependent oxidoreductase